MSHANHAQFPRINGRGFGGSHLQVLYEICVLKNCEKATKTPVLESLFNKVAALQSATSSKKKTSANLISFES